MSEEWAGPWANDAQRLFSALRDVADQAAQSAAHAAESGDHTHSNAAECRYCPICSGLAAVRRSGPELLDRVADLATGLAATWRAVNAAANDAPNDAPSDAPGGAPRDAARDSSGADGAPGHDPGHDDGEQIDLTGAGSGHPGSAEHRVDLPPIQRIDISD